MRPTILYEYHDGEQYARYKGANGDWQQANRVTRETGALLEAMGFPVTYRDADEQPTFAQLSHA